MEPLPQYSENWEAAMRAAQRTSRSQAEIKEDIVKQQRSLLLTPWRCIESTLLPWFRRTRATAKIMAENLVTGKPGWACRVHVTVINLLVVCSFVYLFIEAFAIAFLPPSLDFAAAFTEL